MMKKGLCILFFLLLTSLQAKPLQIGADAPIFSLTDQEGYVHNLTSHRGSFVLLYFFSRDYTFSTQRNIRKIEALLKDSLGDKLVVYGISKDTVKEQRKFYDKMQISFDLLADLNGAVISSYGAKSFFGIKPRVVLIGPDGRLFKIYDNAPKFLESKDLIKAIIKGGI